MSREKPFTVPELDRRIGELVRRTHDLICELAVEEPEIEKAVALGALLSVEVALSRMLPPEMLVGLAPYPTEYPEDD